MGLADFKPTTGGSIRCWIDPDKIRRSVRYFRKSCDLGKKEALRCLGDLFYDGYGVHRCFRAAANTYKEGIARGDATSKYRLAMCYELGHGVPCSIEASARLLREAADEGSAEGMFSTVLWSLNGQHVKQDYGLAFRMLQKALLFKVRGAKGYLGICYDRGIGVDRNPSKAFQFVLESFNEGSTFCIVDLAHCYDTGRVAEKNPIKATKLYEQMRQAGTWHAKFYEALYGLRIVQGLGIEKDESRGKAIILNSTGTGNAIAWYALGECYRNGYGWDVNKKQAARFYHIAVKCNNGLQGQVGSYEALGQSHV